MKTVLSVFFKHKEGGFSKRLYQLYIGLAERGVRVHYVSVSKFPVEHKNIVAHIVRVPCRERENYLFWALFIMVAPWVILYCALRLRVDRFVVFEPFYACLCIPAKLLLRRPIVTFVRSDVASEYAILDKPRIQLAFNGLAEAFGYKASNRVIPNSNQLAKVLRERNGVEFSRIVVIPNNIKIQSTAESISIDRSALRNEYGIDSAAFVVVTVAVLNETKNLSFLIRSFSKAWLPNGHLLIVGDAIGQDKKRRVRLEEEAKQLNIGERTTFTGWLPQPAKLLTACDLFVIPSREEGSPNALLEALACGLPCLGSRIPEIEEVLKHDELLFSLSCDDELTEKLRKAGTDSSYYATTCRLSAQQTRRFTFDWEGVVFEAIDSIQVKSVVAAGSRHE